MHFAWQAQEFRIVAKYVAGAGIREEIPKRCISRDRYKDSCFVMSMFKISDAVSVEGSQISYYGSIILQGSFRVVVTGVHIFFFFVSAFRPVWPGHCIVLSLTLYITLRFAPWTRGDSNRG